MTQTPGTYDAIVVGGGHNGLVSAAYLAKDGPRTVVLERRTTTGGAATTKQPWPDLPGVSVTRLSYVMSLMPPTILTDLQLDQPGYHGRPPTPAVACGIPGMQAAEAVLTDARSARCSPRRLLARRTR